MSTTIDQRESRNRHYEKDRAYHAAIGAEYHAVVVDPRRCANDLLFAPIARAVQPGRRMLDLGCGTGHMLLRFGDRYDERVGVDHSATMLASARRQLQHAGLGATELAEADLGAWLGDETRTFDLVTCVGCLHHLLPDEIVPLVVTAADRLAPGGMLVLAEPVETAQALPEAVARWNARSAGIGTAYSSHAGAAAAEPDEAPIDEALLDRALAAAGLARIAENRGCELLPHHQPPTRLDRLAIRWLHWRYGARGNVLALAARREPLRP